MPKTQYRAVWKSGKTSYWFDYMSMAKLMLAMGNEPGEIELRTVGAVCNE
jgi:hypothetical protein